MSEKTTEETTATEETEEVLEETEEVVDGETTEESEEEETVAKADFDNVQKALDSERAIKKDQAAEIRKLKRELKAATDKTPEDVDSQKLVSDAEKRADKFRGIAVKKEAALALNEAGAKVSTARLIKLLDLDGVEIDDEGKIDGLDDAIEELRLESPEFFKSDDDEVKITKRPTVRSGSVDGGKKTPTQPKPLSAAQLFAKRAVGR